jgi:DNA ligase (NAD+)
LADHFHFLDNLLDATIEDLEKVDGIGIKVASSLVLFFGKAENREIIQRLLLSGVQVESPVTSQQENNLLAGKLFVLTGSLSAMTRGQAKAVIEAHGGRVGSAVTRRTDYVVVGASPGSKLRRAGELGIPVIDERQFHRLLDREAQSQ